MEVLVLQTRGSILMKIELLSVDSRHVLDVYRHSPPRRSSIDECRWEQRRAVEERIVRVLDYQESRNATYNVEKCLIICRHDGNRDDLHELQWSVVEVYEA